MIVRIINSILILVAICMGMKQGYAMISGKPEMTEMFGKWGFTKIGLIANGAITIISAIMIIFPKTFVWGNFLMAAGILLIICFHLLDRDLKGVLVELPFLLINLIIIYLQHPFKSGSLL
ncbi:DoxX family protein [Chryseobacterium wangxinyae]|uniref:DoxX family protein n=1 Tax=Chryseobacterium sp. CY350 TaxID=2997336 RepID=UPI002271FA7D|nr:DoxX family protein [Chryseobacterium sp. CY350]MCY0976378.1 DoxX family protein [Chryseobacterium sp. CY350]WBZ94026.1 DoxX family protein [Chryseobacterium sp. CY350]